MMLQSQPPADILLKNGVVFTADERQPWAESAAVSGNRFLAVGKNADILPLAGEHTKTFDLQGRTVIPGFNDAHTHYIGAAIEEASTFSMFGVTTQAQAGDIITRFATQNPDLEWLHGNRLDLGRFENGCFPDRLMLDRFENTRPVAISDIDGHSCWVNTRALQVLGFGVNTPDPPGGRIVREENGFPSGMLFEAAAEQIPNPILPSGLDFQQVMIQAGERLNRLGITSLSNNGISLEHLE